MRVAVVGAGVYGCTIAVELARAGYEVNLYERNWDLLHGATRANQARLHLGYHYPRSMSTAIAARDNAERFIKRFPKTINRRNSQHYAIASEGSLTSVDGYLKFCDEIGESHKIVKPTATHLQNVDLIVRVPEAIVNIVALREQLRTELRKAGVRFHRDVAVDPKQLDHDVVVMATYGQGWPQPLQWELCEVPVIKGLYAYSFKSFVVLDGPFGGVDPLPTSQGHFLYHVKHSVHFSNVGLEPYVNYPKLVDRGLQSGATTNVDLMLNDLQKFFKYLDEGRWAGSLYSIRAVPPNVDATDKRPTMFFQEENILHVLAGKIDGAPLAAQQVRDTVAYVS